MQALKEYYIKDIATIKSGKRLPKGYSLVDFTTKYPYIKGRDIRNGKIRQDQLQYLTEDTQKKIKRYIVETNDVCITIVANIGDVGIVPSSLNGVNLTENAIRLTRIKDFVSPQFLCQLLSAKFFKEHMELLAAGAAQSKLGIYKIEKIKVLLPLLPTQQRIASILSAYDDLIEVNNQRIKLLEETARELYKEWFVRMRFPGYKKAMFVKGVPEGIGEVKYFKDFIKLNRGFDLPEERIKEGNYPVIASTSIKGYHNQYKVRGPIITTGRSGSLGTVLFVNQDGWPLNTSLYVKDFKGNEPLYVYYTLKLLDFESFNSGAGVPTLNQNHLHKLKMWVADEILQKKFKQMVEPMFQQVEILNQQNTQLRQIRDRLLPRLISGKLEVKSPIPTK
jgi:type I restriction enzyme S subunit